MLNENTVSNVKKDVLLLIDSTHSDQETKKEQHIYADCLMFYKQQYRGEWMSRPKMIESFINEMKIIHCSVHAFHDSVFDNLWSKPKSAPPKIKLTQ